MKIQIVTLDEIISMYIDGKVDFDILADFCLDMDVTKENKKLLMQSILCYDIDVLYETLFVRFADLLTKAEEKKCRERFLKVFDVDFYDT